jgi:hypothetical protein
LAASALADVFGGAELAGLRLVAVSPVPEGVELLVCGELNFGLSGVVTGGLDESVCGELNFGLDAAGFSDCGELNFGFAGVVAGGLDD